MNRLGFLVLSILYRCGAFGKASAMTTKEITDAENLGYKGNTVYKKMAEFEMAGYVAPGYQEGRARTFYITEKGKEFLGNA